ncbi:ankyrin repeat and IBR domain-containing protein 1-like isoform X1 [Dermacentor albipictus]|uniref:ankyrin repeat and IBR domain-containing protein 1-like isoform X1 n=2 Tax=Dermacentor albipictus TaxID=60249 RepID=UPI0031FBBEA9
MGSTSSKFRRHLENGDEYSALQIYESCSELRKSLDPNCFYGDSVNRCTPVHLAAKHGMKPLLRIFLREMQGDPTIQSGHGETALHCASRGSPHSAAVERRVACLSLLIQWRGYDGEVLDVNAKDHDGNTALHYAASSGLKKCVELLVSHDVSLFIENNAGQTACEMADKAGFKSLADYLESKMVFSSCVTIRPKDKDPALELDKAYDGLRPQDLQEAKDLLLVETSDMLHVPLFTAEALLRCHDWSQVALLEAWVQDPVGCCLAAGVQPTTSAVHASERSNDPVVTEEYQSGSLNSSSPSTPSGPQGRSPARLPCNICSEVVHEPDPVVVPCQHEFCISCWRSYLTIKIQEGDVHSIVCPAVGCSQLVPVDIIEHIVSADMVRRYLQFDIEAFVESNPNFKWCPWAGCGRAVHLPESVDPPPLRLPKSAPREPMSHSVDCGNRHYFCWECLGPAHAPCCCEKWKEWQKKVAEAKPEELKSACSRTEEAANCLWMVTNSKPCPCCKSPIQKNEGCNHIKCYKCKHDFCWVCLEPWKRHSSATGGYFRCNRFEAVNRAEEHAGAIISEAETKNKEMQELKKFAHYYTSYKEHEKKHKDETLVKGWLLEKEGCWIREFGEGEDGLPNVHFLGDAVWELLRARRILCGSYAYGYYMQDEGYGKTVFELLQHDLEEATKVLSDMLSSPRLRVSHRTIVESAERVLRKREEFLKAIARGLVPPETPPSTRRTRRRRYPTVFGLDPPEDEQLMLALLESIGDGPMAEPWVKDARGCHANLAALFDWPRDPSTTGSSSSDTDDEDRKSALIRAVGVCSREGCTRPRARNPRTQKLHEYCSLRCQTKHSNQELQQGRHEIDFSMDLMIALELSRMQMIEDQRRFECGCNSEPPVNDAASAVPLQSTRPSSPAPCCSSGDEHLALSPAHSSTSDSSHITASPSRKAQASPTSGAEGQSEPPRVFETKNLASNLPDGSHKLEKDLFRPGAKSE